ncbi:phage EaA protein [Klebsiella pneumoniae]|uniref:ead/Ea22-like family protein n=1 Tax=Klebsiella pneumoniae TaxID=573 RepID=UPI0007CCAFD9|nr:ead/Ea22-like family protein [Klebsiella pneumoniae]SAU89318.1 phage EaA protein [Klebsiella pneumoniae]
MTTDITELAQRIKAAAEKATPGEWVYFPKNTSIEYDVGSDESQGSILYVDSGDFTQVQTDRNGEFIALANPVNVLALVEALEKAQQVDEELCKLLPPGVEYMDPPDGGDVTPLEGVRRMVADYRQLIAELESRTVKLPKPHAHLIWIQAGHAPDDYWDDVAVSHSEKDRCCDGSERYPVYARWEIEEMMSAAGIKVEAE